MHLLRLITGNKGFHWGSCSWISKKKYTCTVGFKNTGLAESLVHQRSGISELSDFATKHTIDPKFCGDPTIPGTEIFRNSGRTERPLFRVTHCV